jgi:flavin reductase (DIM6/NTAB) family NADH-FMN oxidoreductase RutF
MHIVSEPPILYLGTPVVLISTVNEDGSYNLAPMSSAFWLGWRCVLALAAASKTTENLIRARQCVMNLPSEAMVAAVNRLALTTGTDPVPPGKVARGYRYEKRKFEISGLTPVMSQTVAAPRVEECPVQLEAVAEHVKDLAENDEKLRGRTKVFEMRVQRVHVAEEILMEGHADRIDPDKWRPLIMSFQRFYGLSPNQIHESTLGQVPEALYRSPDVDRARQVEALAD